MQASVTYRLVSDEDPGIYLEVEPAVYAGFLAALAITNLHSKILTGQTLSVLSEAKFLSLSNPGAYLNALETAEFARRLEALLSKRVTAPYWWYVKDTWYFYAPNVQQVITITEEQLKRFIQILKAGGIFVQLIIQQQKSGDDSQN